MCRRIATGSNLPLSKIIRLRRDTELLKLSKIVPLHKETVYTRQETIDRLVLHLTLPRGWKRSSRTILSPTWNLAAWWMKINMASGPNDQCSASLYSMSKKYFWGCRMAQMSTSSTLTVLVRSTRSTTVYCLHTWSLWVSPEIWEFGFTNS